ncbi:hypothetical protein FVO59_09335 [Microbacterium esteraromaticum]|uniref:Uncharacterized protein n=1 Tax=Microbacterium esteraromaticum TaxID=57043 RepID=A0A7D7W8G8_9MICO|nr:hypothetical protein [Microbacterium esteraromaticum]QMU97396.1 hypothetical protein FVO59_09335 [Microbacterium esteraromaticum]
MSGPSSPPELDSTEAAPAIAGTAGGLTRRTVAKGVFWSIPVIAAATAAPSAIASPTCTATLSTTTASYTRVSATSAVFTWTDPFGSGVNLTLSLSAVPNGAANMAINTANNLLLDSSTQGGEAVPSVRLSLDTLNLNNAGGGERVTFSFALGGAPLVVDDLAYKIKDLDGFQADDGAGGAERVYLLPAGTGTYNSTWVTGQGTSTNPWRPAVGSPNTEVIPTSGAGNVAVTSPSLSSFSLTFVANNSGREGTDRPNQNIWVGPFTFTAQNPDCVP